MCAKFGFGFWVFVRRGIKSNISVKMGFENNMEAIKEETKEVVDPILEHEPSDLDASLKDELMYILVIHVQLRV